MAKISQKEFVALLVEEMRTPIYTCGFDVSVTAPMVDELISALTTAIKYKLRGGGLVALERFGTFYVTRRKARNGRHPKTGATILIRAKKVPKLKTYKTSIAEAGTPGTRCDELVALMRRSSTIDITTMERFCIAFTHIIKQEIKLGNSITIQHLGRFSLRTTAEHSGHNPRTGAVITIAASSKLRLSFADSMVAAVN